MLGKLHSFDRLSVICVVGLLFYGYYPAAKRCVDSLTHLSGV